MCDVDFPDGEIIANMMNRKIDINESNDNNNKNLTSNKDFIVPNKLALNLIPNNGVSRTHYLMR